MTGINMNEEIKNDISEEEARSALVAKEREAEELLKDERKTNALLCEAQKLLAKIKKIPVIGALVIELIGDCVKGNYRAIPAGR
ncbi:MAG: hypothetical protein LBS35_00340 [Synergistaceae bacterium]|jgi:hypothetical protein|nr:hypothetical protein [Synergistaceae bacterium]